MLRPLPFTPLNFTRPEKWLTRKGENHGFSLISIHASEERMARGDKRNGGSIHAFSVLFDGILTIAEPEKFNAAVKTGIGRGKAMGLGLFSVVPIS